MRVGSSTTISDADLVTYNVKELNRVLKSKGIILVMTMVFMMMVMIQKEKMIVIFDENDNRKTSRQENCANI